jgi:hypothetical protein
MFLLAHLYNDVADIDAADPNTAQYVSGVVCRYTSEVLVVPKEYN